MKCRCFRVEPTLRCSKVGIGFVYPAHGSFGRDIWGPKCCALTWEHSLSNGPVQLLRWPAQPAFRKIHKRFRSRVGNYWPRHFAGYKASPNQCTLPHTIDTCFVGTKEIWRDPFLFLFFARAGALQLFFLKTWGPDMRNNEATPVLVESSGTEPRGSGTWLGPSDLGAPFMLMLCC